MKNNIIIKNCWEIIQNIKTNQLNYKFHPLKNIDTYLNYFGLSPMGQNNRKVSPNNIISSTEPHFDNITIKILVSLRNNVYNKTNFNITSKWSEKLMKFCEVRYHSIEKRALKISNSKIEAKLLILNLASFLLDQAIYTNDLRYLNTVLKLLDLKWVINISKIKNNLKKKNESLIVALFQFRILLLTEFMLQKLYEEIYK